MFRTRHCEPRHRSITQAMREGGTPASGTTPWRSVLGPESRLPNVFWGALSPASLRRMSSFTALPPPEQVVLDGERTYRYVRQESELWSQLHDGRLTSSRLKDALGLRDPAAGRVMGGARVSESGVMRAYLHLLQPAFIPRPISPPPAPPPTRAPPGATATRAAPAIAAAAAANAGEGASVGLPLAPGASTVALHQNEEARLAFNELLAGGGSNLEDAGGAELGTMWSEAERRRISEVIALAVGTAGATRMRLLWGSLQEAAAVATLTAFFPTSQIEEVGLLCLPDSRMWGVEPGELPPLGSSPDALITHHLPITHQDLQASREHLAAAAGGSLADVSHQAARAEARDLLRRALARHTLVAQSNATSAAGARPAATAAAPAAEELTASYFRDRSLPLYDTGDSGGAVDWLARELCRQPAPVSARPGPLGAAVGVERVQEKETDEQLSEAADACGADVAAVVRWREVVEVKNHCPFTFKEQRKARKKGIVLKYVVSDRGPQTSVWALWVPQLQAHMACCGADSALLLSRSASRGVRVFRMFRDDGYVASMLELVRELQVAYVAARQPPGANPWAGRPGYEAFVQRTVAIANGAEAVIKTDATPLMPGTDANGFWSVK